MELTCTTQITDVLEQFGLPPLVPVPALDHASLAPAQFDAWQALARQPAGKKQRPWPALARIATAKVKRKKAANKVAWAGRAAELAKQLERAQADLEDKARIIKKCRRRLKTLKKSEKARPSPDPDPSPDPTPGSDPKQTASEAAAAAREDLSNTKSELADRNHDVCELQKRLATSRARATTTGKAAGKRDPGPDPDSDPDSDSEEAKAGRAFAAHRKSTKAAAAAPRGGKKGQKLGADGETYVRGSGALRGPDRAKYQHPTCFGDAGRPHIDLASIRTFKEMGWTTEELMVDDIRRRLGAQGAHANAHYQAALDILAMPVDGEDFLEKRDFEGAIKFWCEWTAPDANTSSGLQGKRHFFGSKFYTNLYDATKSSWLNKGLAEGSPEWKLDFYCKGQARTVLSNRAFPYTFAPHVKMVHAKGRPTFQPPHVSRSPRECATSSSSTRSAPSISTSRCPTTSLA
jgi:hypothetical protein